MNKFIQASNERIKKFEKDIEAIRAVPPYEEMTLEEFAYHHPNLALNPLEKPTFYPHNELSEIPPDLLAYHRKMGQMHGPDKYHPWVHTFFAVKLVENANTFSFSLSFLFFFFFFRFYEYVALCIYIYQQLFGDKCVILNYYSSR